MKIKAFEVLYIFVLLQVSHLRTTFYQWQCSSPSNNTIKNVEQENQEEFKIIGWPIWMSTEYKYINCSQKGLKRIPQGLNQDVEVLDLGRNSITRIRRNDFAEYSSLVAILLIQNCIISDFYDPSARKCSSYLAVENGAWANLHKLKFLALSGTVMKQLPELLPSSIRVLLSSYANLGPIHKQDVEQQLELVSFSSNCIIADETHFCAGKFTISSPVFASPNLRFLDLAYNNFTSVPGYLFQQSLMGIKLRGNPMNWIRTDDFHNATNITYLNLAWTSQYINTPLQIENGTFAMLKNLEVLDLSANMIRSLPDGIFGENLKLRALNLELNCLSMIEMNPSILPALPLLEELSVAGNTFCSASLNPVTHLIAKLRFNDSYRKFPNLTTLSLGSVTRFPNAEFDPSYSYEYLWYGARYDEVDSESFQVLQHLPKLRHLGLAACGIRVIDTSAFNGLNLSRLDVQQNRIGEPNQTVSNSIEHESSDHPSPKNYWGEEEFGVKIIHNNVFNQKADLRNANSISVIDFSKNSISCLISFSLKYFPFVTHLDLSCNRINYVYENAFKDLSHLQVLNLQQNPIRQICNEALLPLVQLTDLQLHLTEPHYDFAIQFLQSAKHNFRLQYGDTGSYIYRLFQYYGSGNTTMNFTKVTNLDLSYVRIPTYYLSRNLAVFQPMSNIKNLTIDGAQITFHPQSNFFRGVSKIKHLSMRDCWLEQFPYAALRRLDQLRHLDLSYNKIEVITKYMNFSFTNLKTLILSYNFIYEIHPGTLRFFFNAGLRSVDLRFNQFKNINPSIIDRVLLQDMDSIDLRGNAVSCDCSLADTFGSLIHSNKLNRSKLPGFPPDCSSAVVDYDGGCISCDQSTLEKPLSLFVYVFTNNCHQEFLFHLVAWFNFGIVLFLTIALTCKAMKKTAIKILLNNMRLQSFLSRSYPALPSSDVFAYDGFVFYDKDNNVVGNWIENLLVPRLENGNPSFKICVVGKEDWCGTTQVQQLLMRMRASRKTIVVFSGEFLSTPQCQYIVSILEEWMYLKKEVKCVAIVFGNSELSPKTIFRKTCHHNSDLMLHYSPTESNSLFWELLTNAMTLSSI